MTAKQKKAIAALLAAPTVQAAAEAAGVSYSTLRRWLSQDDFRRQYDAALSDLVSEAAIQAKKSLAPALSVLREVAEDQDCTAIARVQAARALVDNTLKLAELSDIMTRLSKLEQSMEDDV